MNKKIFAMSLSSLISIASTSARAEECDANSRVTRTGIWQLIGREPGEDCSGECQGNGSGICRVMPEGSRRWYNVYQREVSVLDGCGRLVDHRVETGRAELGCFRP